MSWSQRATHITHARMRKPSGVRVSTHMSTRPVAVVQQEGIEKNEAGEEFPAPSECIWHVLHTGVTWSHRSGSLRSRRIV